MLAALLAAAAAAASPVLLPAVADGLYESNGTFTVLGPNVGPILYNITTLSPTDRVIRVIFGNNAQIGGSYQQFWLDGRAETMTYCGALKHYIPGSSMDANSDDVAQIWQVYPWSPVHQRFCAPAQAGGCSVVSWDMQARADGGVDLKFLLGAPVVHFQAQFHRSSGSFPDVAAGVQGCQLLASAVANYAWDGPDVPRPADVLEAAAAPAPKGEFEHCYVVHNASSFRLEYTYAADTKVMRLRATALAAGGWIALGFYPQFPGMTGAKVLAALPGKGTVEVLEAREYVGTPTPSNWTTLRSSSVETLAGAATSFRAEFVYPSPGDFTRRNHQEVYYAWGEGQHDGFDYHSSNRGIFLFDPAHPRRTLPSWTRC